MREEIDPQLPYIQVHRSVPGKAIKVATPLKVPVPFVVGALVTFWQTLADRRLLAAHGRLHNGRPAFVLSASETSERLKDAFGMDVPLGLMCRQDFLEPVGDSEYRIRGMSRYLNAEAGRIAKKATRTTGERPALHPVPSGAPQGSDPSPTGVTPGGDPNATGVVPRLDSSRTGALPRKDERLETRDEEETVVVEEGTEPFSQTTTTTPQSGPSADFEGELSKRDRDFLAYWSEMRVELGMAPESVHAELLPPLHVALDEVGQRCPDDPTWAESYLVLDFLRDGTVKRRTLATLLNPRVLPDRLDSACAKALAEPRGSQRRRRL